MNLLPQQSEAVERLQKWKAGALFMEPGTGKTRAAYELVKSVQSDVVVWFTPFQTKDNLKAEIDLCGGLPNLHIIGIESIQNSDRIYLEAMQIIQSGTCFLVVDESIKIKNWQAKRTRRMLELARKAEYRLILNGTPLTRNILDLWAQMEFLSPLILRMDQAEYKNTFCEWVKITERKGHKTLVREFIKEHHNIDLLYSLIGPYVYECALDLPIDSEYEEVFYKVSETELKEYEMLKRKYLDNEKLRWMNNNIFIEMTQKMQHSYCTTEAKFEAVEKLIQKFGHVLIFCKFVASSEMLKERFPDAKILTYGKHALGLNLQAYNTTIFFDKTFDYSQILQAKYRTYRTGQKDNCKYITLTGDVGLESMIEDNIKRKTKLLDYFKNVGIEQAKVQL